MKRIGIREAQNNLSSAVNAAYREPVVITRNGRPVAVLHPVASEEAVQDYLLERNPGFWQEMARRRARTKITRYL